MDAKSRVVPTKPDGSYKPTTSNHLPVRGREILMQSQDKLNARPWILAATIIGWVLTLGLALHAPPHVPAHPAFQATATPAAATPPSGSTTNACGIVMTTDVITPTATVTTTTSTAPSATATVTST